MSASYYSPVITADPEFWVTPSLM